MDILPSALKSLLRCPVCAGELTDLTCRQCQSEFFTFGGILSLMPAGIWQKHLWQHQLALNNQQAEQGFEAMQAVLERVDLMPGTRARAEETLQIAKLSNAAINDLFDGVGLSEHLNPQFAQVKAGPISEYYHHILQDWAWENECIPQRLRTITSLVSDVPKGPMLVLGAGAGRLSWELHQLWGVECTLATDINPLLLIASHRLIAQQTSFNFYELANFPQCEKALSAAYEVKPPLDCAGKRHNWYAIAADVWHMPIQPASMQIIVTSWFLDVHGGDNRDLIGLIIRWLKPGGIWINSGPLLYPKNTPLEFKYGRDELVQLLSLAGLVLENESLSEHEHLNSPLNVRSQSEQVWTFCARKPLDNSAFESPISGQNQFMPPSWLVFHYLPVPAIFTLPDANHPLINRVFACVDGVNSIDAICTLTAAEFPEGLDPRATLVEIFGELIRR